eukprot:gene14790-biopygen15242
MPMSRVAAEATLGSVGLPVSEAPLRSIHPFESGGQTFILNPQSDTAAIFIPVNCAEVRSGLYSAEDAADSPAHINKNRAEEEWLPLIPREFLRHFIHSAHCEGTFRDWSPTYVCREYGEPAGTLGPAMFREHAAPRVRSAYRWHYVARAEDLQAGSSISVAVPKAGAVAVFRHSDGKLYALSDRCAHGSGQLSLGDMEDLGRCAMGTHKNGSKVGGPCVRCPRHRSKMAGGLYFSLEDGRSFVLGPTMHYDELF